MDRFVDWRNLRWLEVSPSRIVLDQMACRELPDLGTTDCASQRHRRMFFAEGQQLLVQWHADDRKLQYVRIRHRAGRFVGCRTGDGSPEERRRAAIEDRARLA